MLCGGIPARRVLGSGHPSPPLDTRVEGLDPRVHSEGGARQLSCVTASAPSFILLMQIFVPPVPLDSAKLPLAVFSGTRVHALWLVPPLLLPWLRASVQSAQAFARYYSMRRRVSHLLHPHVFERMMGKPHKDVEEEEWEGLVGLHGHGAVHGPPARQRVLKIKENRIDETSLSVILDRRVQNVKVSGGKEWAGVLCVSACVGACICVHLCMCMYVSVQNGGSWR